MRNPVREFLLVGLLCVSLANNGARAADSASRGQAGTSLLSRLLPQGRGPEQRVVHGTVLDPNGQPASGVAVGAVGMDFFAPEVLTNSEGRFGLRNNLVARSRPQTHASYITARDRRRNLCGAIQIDPNGTGDVKVGLQRGSILSGTVTDDQGKGIRNTEISLTLWMEHIGIGSPESAVKPDPNGQFEVRAVPANHHWSVSATAEGYGRESVEVPMAEVVGNPVDLPPMILRPANLDVSGVVVDANERPVPNANVACSGHGQPMRMVKSDAEGRFTAHGLCTGDVDITVNVGGPTRRSGSIRTDGGAGDVKIVVSSTPSLSRYVPAKPAPPVGKPLSSIADFGIETPDRHKDQRLLVCIFDAAQRPSRNMVAALARRAGELKQKGVTVVGVQTGEADSDEMKQWLKEQSAAMPLGSIKEQAAKTMSAWGAQGLPWLILTDKEHVVRAEGFGVEDLGKLIDGN
jgi:hypothetical protein